MADHVGVHSISVPIRPSIAKNNPGPDRKTPGSATLVVSSPREYVNSSLNIRKTAYAGAYKVRACGSGSDFLKQTRIQTSF